MGGLTVTHSSSDRPRVQNVGGHCGASEKEASSSEDGHSEPDSLGSNSSSPLTGSLLFKLSGSHFPYLSGSDKNSIYISCCCETESVHRRLESTQNGAWHVVANSLMVAVI